MKPHYVKQKTREGGGGRKNASEIKPKKGKTKLPFYRGKGMAPFQDAKSQDETHREEGRGKHETGGFKERDKKLPPDGYKGRGVGHRKKTKVVNHTGAALLWTGGSQERGRRWGED